MIKKALFILFSMFILSSCQANSATQTKTIETYVKQANQENKKYVQDGILEMSDGVIRLNSKHYNVSNSIILHLID